MTYSITWNVDADGDWGTAANWKPVSLPGTSDDVGIHTADFHTVTYSTGTASVHSLSVGNDAFVVSGGSLSLAAASSFGNALTVSGGLFNFDANIYVAGLFTDSDETGWISGTGSMNLAGGAAFGTSNLLLTGSGRAILHGSTALTGDLYLDGGWTLENKGVLTASGTNSITLGYNPYGSTLGDGTVRNDFGGTIDFNGVTHVYVDNGTLNFTNGGLLECTGSYTEIDAPLVNTGTISVQSGRLDLEGGGSSAASHINVASGATLDFDNPGNTNTFTLNGGGAIGGTGTVAMDGAILQTTASTDFDGALSMTFFGDLALAGNTTVWGAFSQSYNSTISGSGTLTLAGGASFDVSSNLMTGSGTTILEGATTILGSLSLDGGRVLENKGVLTDDGLITLGYNPFDTTLGDGTLKNDVGATIDFGASSIGSHGVDAYPLPSNTVFINAGLVENTSISTAHIDTAFINRGEVLVKSGGLDVVGTMTGGGTVSVDSGATFSLDASATDTANRVNVSGNSGVVTLTGGTAADAFTFGATDLSSADSVTGGDGASIDSLIFSTPGTIAASALANVSGIEAIHLANGANSIALTDALATSANASTLTVFGGTGKDIIDASAVTTAADRVIINGGSGADLLIAGGGADRLVYASALDSTGINFDTISGFNFSVDRFNVPGHINAINAAIHSGVLDSGGSFNSELAAAVDTGHLAGNDAVLFTPDSGSLAGHTFLVVDLNGAAGYQAGEDLVFNLTGATGTLVRGDFV